MMAGAQDRLRVVVASLAAVLVLSGPALAACADTPPEQRLQNTFPTDIGRSLDQIREDGWIEVALYEDFAPWSWEQDGKIQGIDLDIARLIAADLGVELRPRLVQASETLDADLLNYVYRGAVVGGRVSNLFMHAPYDVEYACRFDQVVFTGIYAEEHLAIAYRAKDYPEKPPVPAVFRYDPVAVENDSISDFYLTGLSQGAANDKIHRLPSIAAAMQALAAGEVMAVMAPRSQIDPLLSDGIQVHEPPFVGLARSKWPLSIALSFQHRPLGYEVDDIIGAAIADGRIPAIFQAHGVTFHPPER